MKPALKPGRAALEQTPQPSRSLSWEETRLWHRPGVLWRQLHGSIHELGVSFEWHEFQLSERLDWARSFHPGTLELCLNLQGRGTVVSGGQTAEFNDQTVGFYSVGKAGMEAWRDPGMLQKFLCIEFSSAFLRSHLEPWGHGLHPVVTAAMRNEATPSALATTRRLTSTESELIRSLQRPPILGAAQPPWYLGKALEVIAAFFYATPAEEELFCHRQQHAAADRVEKTVRLLKSHLAEPLSLAEIGKQVGCSPFYLSRTFSREMGMTIPQYVRQIRMEKAAELLRAGKHNVTEAAFEVGYNSLSHFSHAFHQTFGCCPGLYPVKVRPSQKE
ncbi:MAG: helix-turn-helix transcriptional regulator [Verrucomicrobia bacterium]|nr:helix-turn-helix transcriptional regulator [Verrucomicrobiota bacterium]